MKLALLLLTVATIALADPAPSPHNRLTADQKAAGWRLLFDGQSLAGWRGYKLKDVPPSWESKDGAIFCNGKDGTDLITTETFGDFELSLEWKISAGGNSGVHVRATEVTGDTASNRGIASALFSDASFGLKIIAPHTKALTGLPPFVAGVNFNPLFGTTSALK